MEEENEITAPGWAAIDEALFPIYGAQEPLHFGAAPFQRLGGDDPLDGISAYARNSPLPHWHLVSYGMSELYAKESEDAQHSGWGFEFSMRLARQAEDPSPPAWALNFLNNLARYVCNSGNAFDVGHYMDLNGAIAYGEETDIHAIVFADDPEMPARQTVNGHLRFLQVVGITLDELAAIKAWNGPAVLHNFEQYLPLLITDLSRPSLLQSHPELANELSAGAARDGSACGAIFVQRASFRLSNEGLTLFLGATAVRDLPALLPGRIGFDQTLVVRSADCQIVFVAAAEPGWQQIAENRLEVQIPKALVPELSTLLRPVAGSYQVCGWPELGIVIEKSVIRDSSGAVVREVG